MSAAAPLAPTIDYPDGISAVDTEYLRPYLDASHLIVDHGRAAFVDTGAAPAVPGLLRALAAKGVAREAVDYIVLTHIHLDHAGGAGVLARELPNAKVVVHPRGAQHLAEPAKLIAGTKAVYGEERYAQLYGEIVPIPAERIVSTEDGSTLTLGKRTFQFLHTPGHALHHHVMHDRKANVVFTGDTFGLSYRDFDVKGRAFIMPTTTPTHFDPDQLHASIDRIVGTKAKAAYLTHYGRVTELERHARELHAGVRAYVEMARRHQHESDRYERIRDEMFRWLSVQLDVHGYDGDLATRHALLDMDVDLNVQGLVHWLDRGR
jgi:glyoxylase-like metal-dependent hydrolase (beta-lactamase superfamily II)